jgi:hypothetical protein
MSKLVQEYPYTFPSKYRTWQDVAGKQACSTDSSSKAADSSSKAAEITFRIQTCSKEEQT